MLVDYPRSPTQPRRRRRRRERTYLLKRLAHPVRPAGLLLLGGALGVHHHLVLRVGPGHGVAQHDDELRVGGQRLDAGQDQVGVEEVGRGGLPREAGGVLVQDGLVEELVVCAYLFVSRSAR